MADKGGKMREKSSEVKPAKRAKQARTKVPKRQRWMLVFEIITMLAFVAFAVIAAQFVVGYLMVWTLGVEAFQTPVVTTVYSALAYLLALVLVIFVSPQLAKKLKMGENKKPKKSVKNDAEVKASRRKELGLSGWPTWTDIGLAPVGYVAQLALSALLVGIFAVLFPWFDMEQAQNVGYNVLNSGLDRVVAFIALVVIAPIAEEIIFRGWLYGKLRRKLSGRMSEMAGMALAIFLVSLLFGLVHMQWNVGVNVFAVSVVLCAMREFTGTIYSGILVHMLKNGVAFYLLYVAGV